MDVDEGDEQDEGTGAEEESEDTVSSRASSGDEDEEVDPLLRKRIAEALAMEDDPETAIPEEQDASSSGSESDEELMDDEQMLALDEKLAEIFRSSQKTGKKERQGKHGINEIIPRFITGLIVRQEHNGKPLILSLECSTLLRYSSRFKAQAPLLYSLSLLW